jgi:enediyne biosynthesis protein CalE5
MSRFKDVSVERLNMFFDFDSAEAYTNFVCETAAPVQTILSKQSQEKRKEVLGAITEATKKYVVKDSGLVSLSNEVMCIAGRK